MAGPMLDGDYTRPGGSTLSEINITPLVDVMLVLLIIFMVTAPLMKEGIQVDLPKTKAQTLEELENPLFLIVKKDGSLYINDAPVAKNVLKERLNAIMEGRHSKELYIQADQSVSYGVVATVMAEVKNSGIAKVGLVTEPLTKLK